jgi:hypothetical protein
VAADWLEQVYWIGGPPDAGKTTLARALASKHNLALYEFDRSDLRHHRTLADVDPEVASFLAASLDERWVRPEVDELVQRALQSFESRFPLVLADLEDLAGGAPSGVIAEGFGLLPELVAPLLGAQTYRAVWLMPATEFKTASMRRRDKPSFRHQTSDPERARRNLLARDARLGAVIATQAAAASLAVIHVDGDMDSGRLIDMVDRSFKLQV